MLEVPTPPNPLLTDLVSKIDAASMPIAEFWRERDGGLDAPRRKLSYEEEARLKRLIEPRNQGIIDLLIARNANDWYNVPVVLNKGIQGISSFREKTHPFSDNGITIYAPSIRNGQSDFPIRVKLTGLRREDVAENSLEAEALLGEKTEVPDTPEDFMFRTQRELAKIIKLRDYGLLQKRSPQNAQVINFLDQFAAEIIIDRLVELRRLGNIPSGFLVDFETSSNTESQRNEIHENTKIWLPNGAKKIFTIPGNRIGNALASFGFNYDN